MKILILTASAGNGHNSAASRIKEKFLKENPTSEIEIVDAYKAFASKFQGWAIERGYYLACRYFVSLYNLGFKCSEHKNFKNKNKFSCHSATSSMWAGLLNKIYSFKPDLIISTYIFISVALENLKRAYEIPAKIATMTLDFGISPYWECTANAVDYMFLTNEHMVKPFIERGFNDNQLFVTGIPISQEFNKCRDIEKVKREISLEEDLFTLTIMKASFFTLSEKKIVSNLKKIKNKIQIVIINGKDEKSKLKLDRLLEKSNLIHNVKNLGFVSNVNDYLFASDLVLSKAGGLTISELLASKTPSIIVGKLPMQEKYNSDYLCQKNCAIKLKNSNFSKIINEILDNEIKLNELKIGMSNVKTYDSLDMIYSVLKNVETADYSNIKCNDSTKLIKKKINKKRRSK